ncbi:MAG TPA: hypothetical protein VMW87_10350 [Spirochaetia bacterium]|nr:hypothetical protein [Spirochaetia bacterium]
MKKFLVSFIILVVAGAVVFYFGWVQLQLPADTYAVAFTKTGGWDKSVLQPGTFIWRWERIIPTNFRLDKYLIETQQSRLQTSGTLPSGEIYSQYLPGNPSFAFDIALTVSYRLKPDALPQLTQDGLLTPQTLNAYYKNFEADLVQKAGTTLQSVVSQTAESQTFSPAALETHLLSELRKQFPDFEIMHATPTKLQIPDMALYRRARDSYVALLDSKTRSLEQATNAAAVDQVRKNNRLDLLRQYGEVLTQYPVLLKYLALENGQNPDSINLNDLKLPAQGAPSTGNGTNTR